MAASWIDRLESAQDLRQARRIVEGRLTQAEGQAFFDRLRELVGTDTTRARKLASFWPVLAGHPETEAWAHRVKGALQRLEGQWVASARSFMRAGELAGSLAFQVGAVDSLGRAGRVGAALDLARSLASGLDKSGQPREAGQALMNAANALLWHDEYAKARRLFSEALARFDPVEDQAMTAAAQLGLSTAELFGGHPRQALERAQDAEQGFSALGWSEASAIAKKNRAQSEALMGRLDDALDHFLSVRQTFDPSSLDHGRLEEFLGDVYLRMNLLHEAEDAYRSALSCPGMRKSPLNRANCTMGLGMVYARLGRLDVAMANLRRAGRLYRSFGNTVWAAAADVQKSGVALAQGRSKRALLLAHSAARALRSRRSPTWLAQAHLAAAAALVAQGRDCKADLTEAGRLVRRVHALHLEWRVHHLRALNTRPNRRLRHFRQMARSVWESRTLVSSTASRAGYLADKAQALSDYLAHLLEDPTDSRVDEALDVVRNSRSAALLEEILSATSSSPAAWRDRLGDLRDELNSAIGEDSPGGSSRRTVVPSAPLASLQRRWTELTRDARALAVHRPDTLCAPDLVLVESSAGLYALKGRSATKLPLSRDELRERLTWLRFELLAPMTDPGADPGPALGVLHELAGLLWSRVDGQSVSVCPEGLLWQVPWQVLATLESDQEAVLTVGAWSGRAQNRIERDPAVMLWYHGPPELPHIQREAQAVLKTYPRARVCTTLEDVRSAAESAEVDLLHVAAHARFHPTNPSFSSLTFDGGRLTAAEIARSGLRVRQVVLSACETGAVSLQNRSEPDGLARAFLARGAESVLASCWPLDDEAACLFMGTLYDAVQGGESVSSAVHAARRQVIYNRAHPYFWGPFALFGGYAS